MTPEKLDFYKSLIPTVGTVIIAIVSNIVVIRSSKNDHKFKKRERYNTQLETFYYPLILLLKKSSLLHEALDSLGEIDDGGCLVHLLKGKELDENSQMILNEILLIDNDINELIMEHSKYVSEKELRDDLTALSSHYTMLFLANEGKISDDEIVFEKYKYPSGIIEKVEKNIERIEKESKN